MENIIQVDTTEYTYPKRRKWNRLGIYLRYHDKITYRKGSIAVIKIIIYVSTLIEIYEFELFSDTR